MEKTSIYWGIRGKMEDARTKLLEYTKEDLVHLLINTRYNNFVSHLADYGKDEIPQNPELSNGISCQKRVPYIGWYWRDTDFSRKEMSIGNCGDFIGIMENNKWGYPERFLTKEECEKVIEIIESAMRADEAGGDMNEIYKNTRKELEKLWVYIQTLAPPSNIKEQ